MPTAREYQRSVQSSPILRAQNTAQSSPDDFGAGIGRGLTQVGQSVGNVARVQEEVAALQSDTIVKDRRNAYLREKQVLDYDPETGYFNSQGKNAIDRRGEYDQKLGKLREKYAEGLPDQAQKLFNRAVEPIEIDSMGNAARHAGNGLKSYVAEQAVSSADNFKNEALNNYTNPTLHKKYLAAGALEIQELGKKQGWPADKVEAEQRKYLSGGVVSTAIRIADKDPLLAKKYITDNSDMLSADDRFKLDVQLKPLVQQADATRLTGEFLGQRRGGAPQAAADAKTDAPQAVPNISGRTLAQTGPTKVREFLISRAPGKGGAAVDNLDESFATNLAALIQDAPPEIRDGLGIASGFRSIERQRELYEASDKSGKWVARPGGSQHNHGKAVDLMYNGKTIKPGSAPDDVVAYVKGNASKYGMYFPMSYEPWHIEPQGSRGGNVSSVVSRPVARAVTPSYDEMQDFLGKIPDADTRELARKSIMTQLETRSKFEEAERKSAKQELFRMWEENRVSPDSAPASLRMSAGIESINQVNDFIQKEMEGSAVSDPVVVYGLRREAAQSPETFVQRDLTENFHQLGKEDRKELTTLQAKLLSGDRQALDEGKAYTDIYKQADVQLKAVGLSPTGINGDDSTKERQAINKRIAQFQEQARAQVDAFYKKENRLPSYEENNAIVSKLLAAVVINEPGKYFGTNSRDAFSFEAPYSADGAKVTSNIKYTDIPRDLRTSIERDLLLKNGDKPTPEQIVDRYKQFIGLQ